MRLALHDTVVLLSVDPVSEVDKERTVTMLTSIPNTKLPNYNEQEQGGWDTFCFSHRNSELLHCVGLIRRN